MTPEEHTRLVMENQAFENPVADVSRMTPEDLREYSQLLSDAVTELFRFHRSTNIAYGITRAVTQGAKSDEQSFSMMGARPGETGATTHESSIAH